MDKQKMIDELVEIYRTQVESSQRKDIEEALVSYYRDEIASTPEDKIELVYNYLVIKGNQL